MDQNNKRSEIWVQREIFCKKVFGKKYRAMKENSVECQGQRTTNKCMNSEKKNKFMKHKRHSWVCIQCTESNIIDNSKPRHADALINVSVLLC